MTVIDYRYDECGLDNVILKGLPVLTSDDGAQVVTIPFVNMLHRVLVNMVASKDSGLAPKEIRFLRTELGMTQAELARLVGKDVQTIGRWEKGQTPIDTSSEIVIRAHALQRGGTEHLPPMEELASKTVQGARDLPFVINASDPSHYSPLPQAA